MRALPMRARPFSSGPHGVRAQAAFMSTTTDGRVAMQYAASGGTGIVFEIQQGAPVPHSRLVHRHLSTHRPPLRRPRTHAGMVDRGADIWWLSQYPHEREILFGPLTGMEVLATRVDGPVLVVSVGLSINLASMTLEQVVGKRRKLLRDMADGVVSELRAAAGTHPGTRCAQSGMEPIVGIDRKSVV